MATVTFNKGTGQSWVVPAGVTSITIDAYGAAGGANQVNPAGSGAGGYGAHASSTYTTTPGNTLYIAVGGTDGTNGGGSSPGGYGNTGGGMTWISTVSSFAQGTVLMVAGGGGGGGAGSTTGPGGGGGGGYNGGSGGGGSGGTGVNAGAGGSSGAGTTGQGGSGGNSETAGGTGTGVGGSPGAGGGTSNSGGGGGGGGAGYSGTGGAGGTSSVHQGGTGTGGSGGGGSASIGSLVGGPGGTGGGGGGNGSNGGTVSGAGGGGGGSSYGSGSITGYSNTYAANGGDGQLIINYTLLSTISVSDAETETDVVTSIFLETIYSFSVSDTETEGENVSLHTTSYLFSVNDLETEAELTTLVIPVLFIFPTPENEQPNELDFATLKIPNRQPIITFRQNTSPWSILSTLIYQQTKDPLTGISFPVLAGENSDYLSFRIYNNFNLQQEIADAYNIILTSFDNPSGVGTMQSAVAQQWLVLQETRGGEGPSAPGLTMFDTFANTPTPVGGSASTYIIPWGSNQTTVAKIRAGTDTKGCGFVELRSYLQVPSNATAQQALFALVMYYEWNS